MRIPIGTRSVQTHWLPRALTQPARCLLPSALQRGFLLSVCRDRFPLTNFTGFPRKSSRSKQWSLPHFGHKAAPEMWHFRENSKIHALKKNITSIGLVGAHSQRVDHTQVKTSTKSPKQKSITSRPPYKPSRNSPLQQQPLWGREYCGMTY